MVGTAAEGTVVEVVHWGCGKRVWMERPKAETLAD